MGKDRRVGVALDFSDSSKKALTWAINNLVDKGDSLYVIHVTNSSGDHDHSGKEDSLLIPLIEFREPNILKKYGVKIDVDVLDMLDTISRQKEANVASKLYFGGDAREKLLDAIEELKLDSLVMGSRGQGIVRRILMGSVSNYVVSHAYCPVTVVKDEDH